MSTALISPRPLFRSRVYVLTREWRAALGRAGLDSGELPLARRLCCCSPYVCADRHFPSLLFSVLVLTSASAGSPECACIRGVGESPCNKHSPPFRLLCPANLPLPRPRHAVAPPVSVPPLHKRAAFETRFMACVCRDDFGTYPASLDALAARYYAGSPRIYDKPCIWKRITWRIN